MWSKISRTVIGWGLSHEIDSRLHHFHEASFTELFWIRKIIIFTPATTNVNLGRISTTENCIFFFLSILWWLSLANTYIPSNPSGQEGSILPPEVYLVTYSEGFTSPWSVNRASSEARDIHWKHLLVSYVALTSCSDLHFNIQFIESAHFFIPLYVYLGCL